MKANKLETNFHGLDLTFTRQWTLLITLQENLPFHPWHLTDRRRLMPILHPQVMVTRGFLLEPLQLHVRISLSILRSIL